LALIRRDERLLVSRRRADQHLGGLWEFPGGKCETGESPEECAVREALEEVGVHCSAVATRTPLVHAYADRTVCLLPVDCEYIGGEARPLQVAETRWVSAAELAQLDFPAANRSLMEQLLAEN
jgi:mutator protein MutT